MVLGIEAVIGATCCGREDGGCEPNQTLLASPSDYLFISKTRPYRGSAEDES
jgi:hypothetical protein